MVEYAQRGLFGVLTPQANTTVEPELAVMVPKGYCWINARLTSSKGSIEERLVDYYDRLTSSLAQFANAPVGAIAIACTGASYLCSAEREDQLVAEWQARAGMPVITAAHGVVSALQALGARRIGLASPYPDSLNRASEAYWTSRGFHVAAKASAFRETSAFHPIYSLGVDSAQSAVDELQHSEVDAIVMLGTGMPTLRPILRVRAARAIPTISCMLAMTWATIAALDRREPTRADLEAWMGGETWGGMSRLPS